MKNRAKCKLCQSIIESFHPSDYVMCKCGEIAVDGGDALRCIARDWDNFLRVDDEGNEIIVKIDGVDVKPLYNEGKPTREDLIKMLDEMIKNIEALPSHAMSAPVTHYDLVSSLILISSIFKS